jgi:fatty acid hydroxylase domain-containing protein 2
VPDRHRRVVTHLGPRSTDFRIWFTLAIFSTITVHSGYHLPLMLSPEFHDFHHLKFNTCYGVIGLLDCACVVDEAHHRPDARLADLHGTDSLFRSSPQFKNHKILLSLKPLPAASTASKSS